MSTRSVQLSPRLVAALEILRGYETVADVGCDHGRLTASLLQKQVCSHVIATDISEPSLEKAKQLLRHINHSECVSFRVGDGCSVLQPGECEAIALLGMGGTLMARILEACEPPLMGAKAVVLQPMRAQDDIRRYLYQNSYHIVCDRVIRDHGRLYQVFKAVPCDVLDPIPDGFPRDFFDVGYRAFLDREALLPELCRQQLSCHEKMLPTARGTDGEAIIQAKIDALKQILHHI